MHLRRLSLSLVSVLAAALVGCTNPSEEPVDTAEQQQRSVTPFERLMGPDIALFAIMCAPADETSPPFRVRGFFQNGVYPHVTMDSGAEPRSPFFDHAGRSIPSPEPDQLVPFADRPGALLHIENRFVHLEDRFGPRSSITFTIEEGKLVAKGKLIEVAGEWRCGAFGRVWGKSEWRQVL